MGVQSLLVFGAIFAVSHFNLTRGALKEIDEDEGEAGLVEFTESKLEPYGVVCVAYVNHYSPNHELMQKLGEAVDDKDGDGNRPLHHLQIQMAACVECQKEESLRLRFRTPFAVLWPQENMTVPDVGGAVFPAKAGQNWKEKEVRKWLLDKAWPTFNIRNMDTKKNGEFPEAKYMSPLSNRAGVVLIVSNLTGDLEFRQQYQLSSALRIYADKYKDQLHFTFVERSKATADLRKRFSIGVDFRYTAQVLLVERVQDFDPQDMDAINHYHGNPNKYRLEDARRDNVADFFDAWEQKKLPKYFVSKEAWTWETGIRPKDAATRIVGTEFEKVVYEEAPEKIKLVGFFNDQKEGGCVECEHGRKVWERLAFLVKGKKNLKARVEVMAIDQGLNEHPETIVPGKIAQPFIVYYPPGSAKKRRKKRRKMEAIQDRMTGTGDDLLEMIEDLLLDLDEEL